MLLARRWLSPDDPATRVRRRPRLMHWVEHYRLADRELRVRVRTQLPPPRPARGRLNLRTKTGVRLLLVKRGRGRSRRFLATGR